jgi:hypothetical protein
VEGFLRDGAGDRVYDYDFDAGVIQDDALAARRCLWVEQCHSVGIKAPSATVPSAAPEKLSTIFRAPWRGVSRDVLMGGLSLGLSFYTSAATLSRAGRWSWILFWEIRSGWRASGGAR